MQTETTISKPKWHSGQLAIVKFFKRFNVLAMGRRYGKTKAAVRLAMETMIEGKKVGYFVPTPEFAEEFWDEIKERLEPITIYKSESKRIIRIVTGGELKIWSMEKLRSGRGRKYHRVIIDEAAFGKDLKYSWEKVIRATLADYAGDAFFLSSPVFGSYFHTLFEMEKKFKNWASFQMPTDTNPYISKDELKEIEAELDPLTWAQEFLAQFVNMAGRAFAYCFDRKKHVPTKEKPFNNGNNGELRNDLPVYLSFDFNVDPITCIAAQHPDDHSYIYVRHEFRLRNSNIWELCDEIKTRLGGHYFIITGDASGKNKSAMVQDGLNYYLIIKAELKLKEHQFKIPGANPKHKNSRVLTNSLLYRHPKLFIHRDCPFLIEDLERVQVDKKGDIDKSDDALGHLLDTFRYYLSAFFSSFVRLR